MRARAGGGKALNPAFTGLGMTLVRLVGAHRELGSVGGLRELVQRLADGERLGRDQVEGAAGHVVVVQVGDVVHRLGDEVHRHQVGLRPSGRPAEPLRQRMAQLLDQLEEVVGPVDLVHRAGLGMTDHDARSVDAERLLRSCRTTFSDSNFRAVVRVREVLLLVEHVLAEQALEAATAVELT